ncbi:MAG: GIY-YIG nuclease family protein [Woeseia sp.]
MSSWSVYLVRCGDGSFYTGIATDVHRRVAEHAQGQKGARYLRGRGPLELVFQKEIGDRGVAARIEHRIKRLPKALKEDLGQLPNRIEGMLREFSRD